MPKEQVSAEEVTQAILHRITTGQIAPGDHLPPVRKLAEDLGSNRNTVSKAYQMLFEMGILEGNAGGRKGYTIKHAVRSGEKSKNELLNYFFQQSIELVWQGMAAGISADEMLEQSKKAVDEVFGQSRVDLIFFECNDYDTTEMGRRLNEVLDMPVEYKNLSFFYKSPAAVIKKFDLLITTYHHLAEITAMLSQLDFPPGKVVGIDTRLAPETMLRIARFPCSKIGVVCTNQTTAHMLKHVLYGYHPEWDIQAYTVEEPEAVKALAKDCDHFIVTHTSAEEVTTMTGRTPDVVVNFQIDEQSIAFLNQRIHQIRIDKMKPVQTNLPEPTETGL